jgi:phosphoglycerate-specific signal transduction histidine kinase
MKKFNWILFLVLNYVTCGLWGIYVWTVITKNKNVMAEKYGVQKIMGYIPTFLLTMITCGIYGLVWFYKMSKQQVELNKALKEEIIKMTAERQVEREEQEKRRAAEELAAKQEREALSAKLDDEKKQNAQLVSAITALATSIAESKEKAAKENEDLLKAIKELTKQIK